jgi:hypothetical protein
VLLFLELLDLGGVVLLVDAAFASVAVDIGELVDAQGVFLVERGVVELADRSGGLGGRRILDKRKPAEVSRRLVPRSS